MKVPLDTKAASTVCPENGGYGRTSEEKNQLQIKTATREVVKSSGDINLTVWDQLVMQDVTIRHLSTSSQPLDHRWTSPSGYPGHVGHVHKHAHDGEGTVQVYKERTTRTRATSAFEWTWLDWFIRFLLRFKHRRFRE